MNFIKTLDKFFWIFMLTSIFLGFTYPSFFLPFEGFIIYIIMTIMGLLFLKVDVIDILTHIKVPSAIIYINII